MIALNPNYKPEEKKGKWFDSKETTSAPTEVDIIINQIKTAAKNIASAGDISLARNLIKHVENIEQRKTEPDALRDAQKLLDHANRSQEEF